MKKLTSAPKRRRQPTWIALLYSMLLFAAAWCVWALCTPLLGDDAVYAFKMHDFGGTLDAPLRHGLSIWNNCNARMGDILSGLWLGWVPRWIPAIMTGCGIFLTMWGLLRLCNLSRRPLTAAITAAIAYLLFPWDDLLFYVCQFNYVWGTALISLVLLAIFDEKMDSRKWLWGVPVAFVASATHEALGFPLGCALILYWYLNKNKIHLTGAKKWWVIAILLGSLFCISSPASYQRVGAIRQPDLSPLMMVVKVLPLPTILFVRIIWLWVRRRLKPLLHTRWLIFAATAIVSSCFTMIGGIEGRGGWYAEFFALTALAFDFQHNCSIFTATRKWVSHIALIIALGCNIFVVIFGLKLMDKSVESRSMADCFRYLPNKEAVASLYNRENDDWVITCLPLTVGGPVFMPDGTLFYMPELPLAPGEKNPTDPCLELR